MDIYLLKLVGNWLSVLFVSLVSFLGIDDYSEAATNIENTSYTKTATVVNEVIPYKTEYVYNPNKASTAAKEVLVKGEDGISYTYENGETKVLKEVVNEVIEIGTGRAGKYVGRLTNYGGDCPGCSKTATVACRTESGKRWSLFNDGIYYTDDEYGKARIVAADLGGFPCGTVIMIDDGRNEPFLGIVLDTGATMRKYYKRGYVWMDLAYQYQATAARAKTGSKKTTFTIQRWGW